MLRTRVGYAGGTQPHPTYHRIGDHTETFQVDFDPEVISYADLLERVWRGHDPTAAAWSRQYRNVILVGSPAQREAAEASRDRWQAKLAKPITTQIEALRTFTRAEDYHQKYYLRGQARLASALVRAYPDADAFTDSSAAMRLNAYLGGHGDPAQLQRELPWLGLDGEAQELLLRAYTRRR